MGTSGNSKFSLWATFMLKRKKVSHFDTLYLMQFFVNYVVSQKKREREREKKKLKKQKCDSCNLIEHSWECMKFEISLFAR